MDYPTAKKSLGQHWLNDDVTLQAIVDAAEVVQTDHILEIGPGAGTLTKKLVAQAADVVAVEFDSQLAARLPQRVNVKNLSVVSQDILKFDLTSMPADYKVVANIPYYLTSNLIRTLSESSNQPSTAVLLIQKEVAERVAAQPGQMSLLSVTAQFYWEVSLGIAVPAHLFTPPPKVDSLVLVLHRRPAPLFDTDAKAYFRVVKAGFSNRRKTLHNSLSAGLHMTKPDVTELLDKSGIDGRLRPQNLSLQQWYEIYTQLANTPE